MPFMKTPEANAKTNLQLLLKPVFRFCLACHSLYSGGSKWVNPFRSTSNSQIAIGKWVSSLDKVGILKTLQLLNLSDWVHCWNLFFDWSSPIKDMCPVLSFFSGHPTSQHFYNRWCSPVSLLFHYPHCAAWLLPHILPKASKFCTVLWIPLPCMKRPSEGCWQDITEVIWSLQYVMQSFGRFQYRGCVVPDWLNIEDFRRWVSGKYDPLQIAWHGWIRIEKGKISFIVLYILEQN